MYKYIFVLLLLFGRFTLSAQKKYICEYSDTSTTILPDSILAEMLSSSRPDIEIPPEVMQQFLSQMKVKPIFASQQRVVKAANDKTIISIERSTRSGNLTMETFDSALYKNDELFLDSASSSGFASHPINIPRKVFFSTGNSKEILKYKCDEYLSTDSTCRIWVTKELPDYLNPGIRKGKVKGAVLGFELKANVYFTKCILKRFGRGL
jgi:hypothetical protein